MGKGRAKPFWLFAVLLVGLPVQAGTLVDMVGREVELHRPPRRIISLAPSLTEILYALGAGDAVVGVTDYANYPSEVKTKPSVGGGINPNMEMIVTLKPDLVLISADANRWDTLSQLEQLQIPVYGVKPMGVEGVFTAIARIGEVVGRQHEAERVIIEMRRRMATVSQKVKNRPRPKVLYAVWIDPLIVAGRETVIHDLIQMAGGRNVVRESGFPRYSLEEVVVDAPDVIVLALDGGVPEDREVLRRLPGWREMRAVREGAVRVVDANLMNRPGPRIVDGVELLAGLLHPASVRRRRS
ncbi:MAG: ABC transporter substrate-binding protein [Candidatus Methylomirabilales bacterium]